MKILLISHNCLSTTSAMGKTLLSYFSSFRCGEIAQFYIHCEEPMEDTRCRNYYRFTDMDAVKSVFTRRERGRIFGKQDIRTGRTTARTDTGWLASIYRCGERRTPMMYLLRELLWKCSRWETKGLWRWIEEFAPDVIFFASGDYGFSYEIAEKVARHVKKPLVVCCVDDHYLYNRNEASLIGRLLHRRFMKTVDRTMARADLILTICDSLRAEYERLFQKRCCVLHTSAPHREVPKTGEPKSISYLGRLELKREQQLIAIGRALQAIEMPGVPRFLDVYSYDQSPELLKDMTPENGIRFHGAISGERVLEVMGRSMAVIHTESFDPQIQKIVRHSVSTKIAESLMYGPCLIAYGPEGIASINYLKENGAAYLITDPKQLQQGLQEILTNAALREEILVRARELARKNHSIDAGPAQLRLWLGELCAERWEYEGFTDQLRLS